MNSAFSRLPLPVKLLLIGLVPLAFLIYASIQIYTEKTQKVNLLGHFIERIQQSANINTLIDHLQKERKFSFDYAMTKVKPPELYTERPITDSIIRSLEDKYDPALEGFKSYTFLNDLNTVRNQVDSGTDAPNEVMHYYSTMIYRLNTLNTVSYGSEIYLQPVYRDLVAQKLLSEMITNLGIIRSNIYNVLYTKQYMVETLIGLVGVHDIYNTYETEFLIKASPSAKAAYNYTRNNTELRATVDYLDTLFQKFAFDSTYTAAGWWAISDRGIDELTKLQQTVWSNVHAGTNAILNNEKAKRTRSLIILIIALVLVSFIVIYSILNITRTLTEMKIAAQKISEGATGLQLPRTSNDVIGHLAESISRIDDNNKLLAQAADAIGKGNFETKVIPRGSEDILGNAVLRMKDNLMEYSQVNRENNEQLRQLAEKYKTIFYKSPLPKWIYDFETLRFLEVNEAAVRQYGYTQEEFKSMTILDIRPEEEKEKVLEDIERIKKEPDSGHGYWRHRKKNGQVFTVEIMAHFIDYNNKIARLVVTNDITEKLKAEELLKQSHEELRNLASRLQDIREEERANMAREVHDVLGQQITCLKMDISWLSKTLTTEDSGIREKLSQTIQLLDQTATIVRKIAAELRPSILDDFGLIEALDWQGKEFEKRSGITVQFSSTVPPVVIGQNITIALFRIYQESLTNVARHASASLALVKIGLKDDELILTITDNGNGFDVRQIGEKKTLGILGMKERTLMIGGKYEITSIQGKGTTVTVIVPLEIMRSTNLPIVSH